VGRTREGNARKADIFRFAVLAEGWWRRGVELSARVERTERPEEDRLDDLYRSVRPLLDQHLGRTRWHIVTVNVGPGAMGRLQLTPFAEGARLRRAPRRTPRR
jgi:hypothetical protein